MRITLSSGTPAELVRPDSPTRGVVLWPDIMGLRPLFDALAQRLADEHDWSVCMPEMFPGAEAMSLDDRLATGARDLDDDMKLRDALDAADATGCEQVAVAGFCMGGMYALKCLATGRFDRAVAFYGMVRTPTPWSVPGRRDALDIVAEADPSAALLISGTVDPWLPAADLDAFAAIGATVVRYDGADHGFMHDPDRPTHRADDAADAWARAVAFIG